MEALVPAFVAALLAGVGDRPAAFAALLGGARWPAIVFGHAVALTIAGVGGALVAPLLSPNARAFLLALSLLFAGLAALFPARVPGWSLGFARGGPGAVALGTSALALGDRTAFIAFALAARGPSPALAVAGALGGAIVVAGAAMTRRLPTRALSVAGGVLLAATGAVVALGALRLI